MVPEWITQYWVQAFFGFIITVLGVAYNRLTKRAKKIDDISLGLQAVLRIEITREYNKWMEREYCPVWAKEMLDEMYSRYSTLGGNGTGKHLYECVMDLPTEKPAKRKRMLRVQEMGKSSPAE